MRLFTFCLLLSLGLWQCNTGETTEQSDAETTTATQAPPPWVLKRGLSSLKFEEGGSKEAIPSKTDDDDAEQQQRQQERKEEERLLASMQKKKQDSEFKVFG